MRPWTVSGLPVPLIDTPTSPGQCLVVTGKKRDGKSWWVWHQIFLKWSGAALYLDPKGADAYMVGDVRHSLEEIVEEPARKFILRPEPGSNPHEFDAEVNRVLLWLIEWKRGWPGTKLLVVIDEAQRYLMKSGMEESIDALVQSCAAMDLSTVLICPDYSQIPRQLFQQADFVAFFTSHPVIKMYLEERMQTEVPPSVWRHLEQNVPGNKGHGFVYDWQSIQLINPDGSMVDAGEAEETEGEDDEGEDLDNGNPAREGTDAEAGDGDDGAGGAPADTADNRDADEGGDEE